MRTLLFTLLISLSVTPAYGKYDPDRPEAQPNQELSFIKKAVREFSDFIFFEYLGYQSVREENETLIRTIITELEMDEYCIEIRGMSNFGKHLFGRTNAFVAAPIFWTRQSHSYLYISEDWFDTLSTTQKEALIKHELMHIKHHHAFKKFWGTISAGTLCSLVNYAIQNNIVESNYGYLPEDYITRKYVESKELLPTLFQFIFSAYYSRILEKEADIEAAKTMTNKDGFVDLFNEIKSEITDPESKFILKRFISNFIFQPLEKLFASHPELDDRIAYIQELS